MPTSTPVDDAFLAAWNALTHTGKTLGHGAAYGQKHVRGLELMAAELDLGDVLEPREVARALESLGHHLRNEFAANPAEAELGLVVSTAGALGLVAGIILARKAGA